MTETRPPIATPEPFRYQPVPFYPEDWESICTARDINGGPAKKLRRFWRSESSMLPNDSMSLSTASPINANPQETYHQPAQVLQLESDLWNARSTMWTNQLPSCGIRSSNVSSISANAILLATLPFGGGALPRHLDDHFAQSAGLVRNSVHELVPGLHGLQTRQTTHSEKTEPDGMSKAQDDVHVRHMTGFLPQYASMPRMNRTYLIQTGVTVPCEARTEAPTINPSIALRNNSFGTNRGESMATPKFVDSDTSLFGCADTVAPSPESCLSMPTASSCGTAVDIPAAVLCAVDESKLSGNVYISKAIPPANVSGVSSNKTVTLKRKRKHDSISSASVCENNAASQSLAKHGILDSYEGMPSLEIASGVPLKRKPGRPLSTSSTARAIVRSLAALNVQRNESQAGQGSDFFDHDLQVYLPPFPRVNAYVGEQRETAMQKTVKSTSEPAHQGNFDSEELRSGSRPNKVAAKKHRELIKERTQNLEDVNVWLDQALIEYERRNSKLVNTVARLRKENEAIGLIGNV